MTVDTLPEDLDQFREVVRAWLVPALQRFRAEHADRELSPAELGLAWERFAYAEGWAAPGWPVEYGGRGLTLLQQVAYYEELARHGAPEETNRPAKRTFAPTLMQHGTKQQKDRHLAAILSAAEVWCQGFSEPGAGSDLAAIRTEGRIDGDVMRVTGQKTWSSNATFAQYMFALIRTEPGSQRHAGLSLVIIDMSAPGIEVRPIRKLTGDADFAEVFLTDVVVPLDNVVGPVNQGWSVAMDALASERSINMVPHVVEFVRYVAEAEQEFGATAAAPLRAALDRARVLADVLTVACYRAVAAGPGTAAVEASLLKLGWSEASQAFLRAVVDATALDNSLPPQTLQRWRHRYLKSRAQTIWAGTSEIQRNVIAKRGLGLPTARGKEVTVCGWL